MLLYGIESWTYKKYLCPGLYLLKNLKNKLDRHGHKIESILGRMRKEKEILCTIKKRKLQYLDHVMRGEIMYRSSEYYARIDTGKKKQKMKTYILVK